MVANGAAAVAGPIAVAIAGVADVRWIVMPFAPVERAAATTGKQMGKRVRPVVNAATAGRLAAGVAGLTTGTVAAAFATATRLGYDRSTAGAGGAAGAATSAAAITGTGGATIAGAHRTTRVTGTVVVVSHRSPSSTRSAAANTGDGEHGSNEQNAGSHHHWYLPPRVVNATDASDAIAEF